MRRVARLLPYVALLLLPLVAAVVLLRTGPLTEHLRKIIASEISRQTDREVSIGAVSISLFGDIVVSDLVIENRDGSPLLTGTEASAQVGSLGEWLRRPSKLPEVRGLKLTRPEVTLTRYPDGQWSISDLLARQREAPSRFRGEIRVEEGRLVVVDEMRGGQVTELDDVELTVSYPEPGRTVFSLRGNGVDDAFGVVEATGRSEAESGRTSISGTVSDVDVVYGFARLPEMAAFNATGGRGDVTAEVSFSQGSPELRDLDYSVEVLLTEASVEFPWLRRPATGVNGTLRVANGEVYLEEMSGEVGGAPIAVSGRISDFADPQLALDLSSPRITLADLQAIFPNFSIPLPVAVRTPLSATARVEGPTSSVTVQGMVTLRVMEFRWIPWHDVQADFRYSRGHLSISNLRAHGSPRRLAGDFEVDWSGGRRQTRANISMSDVPVAMLAQMAGLDGAGMSGTGSLTVVMDLGQAQPSASGEITLREAAVRGIPLGTVACRFELAGQSVTITEGAVEGPLAMGGFSGTVVLPDRYDFAIDLSSMDMSAVGPLLGASLLEGRFPAAAQVRGVLGEGRVAGTVRLGPGSVQGRSFESLAAGFDVSPARLRVVDLSLRLGSGQYRGQLEVADWQGERQNSRLAGEVSVERAALRDWVPANGVVPEGFVDGMLSIDGTLASPRLDLTLGTQGPAIAGHAFETGRAHVRYEQGRVLIDEMFIDDGRTHLELTGQYALASGLSVELVADPLDLSSVASGLRRSLGLTVTGQVSVLATATGSPRNPEIDFDATSTSVVLNEIPADEVALSGHFADGVLTVRSARLRRGDSAISVSGNADLRSRELAGTLRLERIDLSKLFTIGYGAAWRMYRSGVASPKVATYASILSRPVSGWLDAEVDIAGTASDPRAAIDLAVTDLAYDGRRIQHIEGSLDLSRQTVEMDLRALHEEAHASILGSVSPGGDMFVSADIGNLDLSLLEPWVGHGLRLGGEGTINFDLSGQTSSPVLRGDAEVDNFRLGPLTFERMTMRPISLNRGRLTVEQVRLVDGPMEARGSIAFPLGFANGVGDGAALSLPRAELHVTDAEYALVPQMSPATFDADFYLRGDRLLITRQAPEEGSGDREPGVRGRMGEGSFSIEGEVELAALAAGDLDGTRFDVTCTLDDIGVVIGDFLSAQVRGTLLLTNDEAGLPLLTTAESAGAEGARRREPVVVSHAVIGIPPRGSALAPPAALPVAPAVQVRMLLGEDVRFRYGAPRRPTEIKIDPGSEPAEGPATGYLDIGGVASPAGLTLDGHAETHEGVLAFPNAMLTVRHGAVWVERRNGERPQVRVEAEADGRVGDYSVSLRPAGLIYPMESDEEGRAGSGLFSWQAASIPYLDEALVMVLLAGPVVAPSRGARRSATSLLAEPGSSGAAGGEITGIILPPFGSALGVHQLSLDFAIQGPVRLRLGERLFSRVVVSYVSALSGPSQSRTLRMTYEIPPLWSLGWSVDELGWRRWEAQAFIPF